MFKLIEKDNERLSAQGVIHYNGPLRRKQGSATIKLDLTNNEIMVLKPETRRVHHPYSDEPTQGVWANCYAFEEVVAEKIRALAVRTRPRDLYDVVHFFRNRNLIGNPQIVYNVLIEKCSYKKIPLPSYKAIQHHDKLEELDSQWQYMLARQLPMLPTLESFWQDLEPFFQWLEGNLLTEKLTTQLSEDEEIFIPDRIMNVLSFDAVLHKIQFAAANRVCIELTYDNKKHLIEPLSLRRSKAGNKLFYGYEEHTSHPKSYSITKIQDVVITNLPYRERAYPIEINATGQVLMPPIRRR